MNKTTCRFCILVITLLMVFSLTSCKKKVTVTFDEAGGIFTIDKYDGYKGEPISFLDELIPIKEGYEFIGWYEKDSNQKWTSATKIEKNTTLIAKYKENTPILIEYELDGGVNNPQNPSTYIDNFTLLEPSKEGFIFKYWEYNGSIVTQIPNVLDNPIVLKAIYEKKQDKLIYDLNGGINNPQNPLTYEAGALLYEPSKHGYVFDYWEYNGNIITSIPETSDESITIRAHFTAIQYTITYELNGGINNEMNKLTFTAEDLPLKLYDPSFEGYTFIGWYCDEKQLAGIPNVPSIYCKDLVLEAKFELHYNITYLGEGLDTVNNPTTYISSQGARLKNPVKNGYNFAGWVWNSNIITSIPAGTTGDIVLTSLFDLAEYTITYELDGGINSSKNPNTYTVERSDFTLFEPTKENYVFLGWSLDGQIINKFYVLTAKNVVLIAMWEIAPTYHTIIYELNGGTVSEIAEPKYQEGVGCTLPIPIKTGYTFKGWNTSSDGTGNYISTISSIDTADYHVFAIWEKDAVLYNITYELNGGVATNLPQTYEQGKPLNLPHPQKPNSTFSGWYLSPNFSGEGFTSLNKDAMGDLVLYAKFNSNNQVYTITYYVNGGTFTTNDIIYEFTKDTETFMLPNLTREGFIFDGWEDENKEIITSINKGTMTDIRLQARFTSQNTVYNIKYINNGGNIDNDAIFTVSRGANIELPSSTKLGANFVGWHLHQNLSDNVITSLSNITSNIVLYAEYQNIIYNITYEVDVENLNPQNYTIDEADIYLEPVVKEGYEFIGWFNLAGQEITVIESGSNEDFYLVAKFEPIIEEENTHIVTFVNYDGSILATQKVIHGMIASELIIGQSKGLSLSWYLDGEIYNFNNLITNDIMLEAKWSVIDDIYNQIFTTPEIVENIKIQTEFDTPVGIINVHWRSDKYTNINMVTGAVNQEYSNVTVKVTGQFTFNGQQFTVDRNIIVGKVNFVDLSTTKPVIGYFYSRTASCEITDTTISTLDIINYGFATATSQATVNISDLKSIERIIALRQQGIRVLLCIGGYGAAGTNFSLAAKTEDKRKKFAQSILDILIEYHFDGVDVDWEYPGYLTGTDVAYDRPNYTLLMQEIKNTLKAYNPEYLVTAALPGGKYGYTRYELRNIGQILDYVNLMTYDLQSSTVSTHHTGLFNGSYTPHGSVEQTVEIYSLQGIPKNKLIVGIAFYGRRFNVKSNSDGIGCQNSTSESSSITYSNIYLQYLVPIANGSTTIKRYWDNTTKAPYIYDSTTGVWISYDDAESIKHKCQYVKDNNLGGLMFWDYGEDDTLQLIQAIYDNFH